MGLMRFLVPGRQPVSAATLGRAYFAGSDDIPWQSRIQATEEGLAVRRSASDSGSFHIPWPVAGHGELMLMTASLMERERPYHLPVELARGTISRLSNQLAAWDTAGVPVPGMVSIPLAVARASFSQAATQQGEPLAAAEHADRAISAALDAIAALGSVYAEHANYVRQRQLPKTTAILGVSLGSSPVDEAVSQKLAETFNTAVVPLAWGDIESTEGTRDWQLSDRQIEWCRTHGLKVCGGPLLQLDRYSVPDWIYLWEADDDSVLGFMAEHIKAVVARYRGKVHLWQVASRLNVCEVLSLSEEQRLRAAVLALESVRSVDANVPVIVTIDQPWAEFMGNQDCELSPWHFADALARADLGMNGVGLEINLGYFPHGTQPRDLLDFSRQLDRWTCLGLPLIVMITVPSDEGADANARKQTSTVRYSPAGVSPEGQARWLQQFVPLLLAKQPVQGIIWNQLSDSKAHDYPHGGLFDQADEPKPALAALQILKQKYFI